MLACEMELSLMSLLTRPSKVKHISPLSGVALALLAISLVGCGQSLEPPYDRVISECPFSGAKAKDFTVKDAPGYRGGENYQRNCDYDDGRVLQSVVVFDTPTEASIWFREFYQPTLEYGYGEFDSNNWMERRSLLEHNLADISPPKTDEFYTSFGAPSMDEDISMRALAEVVHFRVGRYVGLVEVSQPPAYLYYIGREAYVQEVYEEAKWQASHHMVRQLRALDGSSLAP